MTRTIARPLPGSAARACTHARRGDGLGGEADLPTRGPWGTHCRAIRPLISRVFWVQCLLTAMAAVASMPFGRTAALSALIGGVNSLVPTAYFAHKVLRRSSGANGGRALGVWLRAEVAKIAIIGGMFAAAFVLLQGLNMVALFAGFIVVHVGGVIASMTLDPHGGARD